jgi:hypothetical protein
MDDNESAQAEEIDRLLPVIAEVLGG